MSQHPQVLIAPRVPHRHPMLLLDEIESLEPGSRAAARKLVSAGEVWREGERGMEVAEFPSSLLIDALGQVAIAALTEDGSGRQVWFLAAVEALAIESHAQVGEQIDMQASLGRSWRGTSRVAIEARVGDRLLMSGTMVLAAGAAKHAPAAKDNSSRKGSLSG